MKRYVHERSAMDMLRAFEERRDELKSSEDIEASFDDWDDEDDDDTSWERIQTKDVRDPSDGFWTEYSLWHNVITDEWVTVFGDTDLYNPSNSYTDMEFDSEEEAREWFEYYDPEQYDNDGYDDLIAKKKIGKNR